MSLLPNRLRFPSNEREPGGLQTRLLFLFLDLDLVLDLDSIARALLGHSNAWGLLMQAFSLPFSVSSFTSLFLAGFGPFPLLLEPCVHKSWLGFLPAIAEWVNPDSFKCFYVNAEKAGEKIMVVGERPDLP